MASMCLWIENKALLYDHLAATDTAAMHTILNKFYHNRSRPLTKEEETIASDAEEEPEDDAEEEVSAPVRQPIEEELGEASPSANNLFFAGIKEKVANDGPDRYCYGRDSGRRGR